VGRQNGAATLEASLAVPHKARHTPATWLTGDASCLPTRAKSHVHTQSLTQIVTAALVTIGKTWAQPRCPSVGDR
jgi:hypothetical protein